MKIIDWDAWDASIVVVPTVVARHATWTATGEAVDTATWNALSPIRNIHNVIGTSTGDALDEAIWNLSL